ncbi:MAG: lamin tail domain-containing protein, partial [Chloroflexi bacterium]|nr:lamin tail domain-containing protein [Chloroflexota bacterium]
MNEVLTNPGRNWRPNAAPGEPPLASEWIELLNATGADVDLAGWYLVNAGNLPSPRIGAGNTIPAHGYVVIYAADVDG